MSQGVVAPSDALGRPSMSNNTRGAQRGCDAESLRPVPFEGGVVLLCETYRETNRGVKISTGEIPVGVADVEDFEALTRSMMWSGFTDTEIERALDQVVLDDRQSKVYRIRSELEHGHAEVLDE